MNRPDPVLVSRALLVSRGAAVLAMGIGASVLAGWVFDVVALKSVVPGLATMKPNTALALLLAGTSLLMATTGRPLGQRVSQALGALVVLISAFTLAENAFNLDLSIDELLFRGLTNSPETLSPGRMAPVIALCLLFLGAALVALGAQRARSRSRTVSTLAISSTLLSFLALIGYAYDVESLYRVHPYASTAVHSALALFALSLGILCAQPDRGPVGILTSRGVGGMMARRLALPAVLLPLALGTLRLFGERGGLYGTEFGVALFTILITVMFSALIWLSALSAQAVEAGRLSALEALKASEARKGAIVEGALDCIVAMDRSGRVVEFNPAAERTFGYARAEAMGRQMVDLIIPPALREAHRRGFARYLATREARILNRRLEMTALRADGTEFPTELAISVVEVDGEPLFTGHLRDITARKQAEEEIRRFNTELEDRIQARTGELERANKELEAFSYSVSHDLRAPLRAISGFAGIISQEHGAPLAEPARRYLKLIQQNALHMGQLIDDLLDFSRLTRQPLNRRLIPTGELVRQVLDELREEQADRQVIMRVGELPSCDADAAMLRQVFMNLLSNALKYTRKRETAEVEVGAVVPAQPGDPTVFFVRDNGVGFDMRYAGKLFGVFQRLHPAEEYEGTGVGLALVERIITRHGGRVWAEAEPGRGAAFYFTLGEGC